MSQLFEKYGEFESYETLIETIRNQIAEGDDNAACEIFRENGLDPEDFQDILEGDPIEEVLTPCIVALGKLQVESKDYQKHESIIADWIEYIKALAIDSEEVSRNIRRKGKSLNGCLGELLKFSYHHAFDIPEEIKKAAGITGARVKLGIPNAGKCKEIIREYYGR